MLDPYQYKVIHEADTGTLKAMHAKVARNGNLALAAWAGCFLAGVWLDWRWFLTALLPLGLCGFFGYLGGAMRRELATRPKGTGDE